jgi:DNA-damage-inducible protein J
MTTSKKKRLQIYIDKELVDDAESVLHQLGLNPSVVINALYHKIVMTGSLSFDLKLSPREKANLAIIQASKNVPNDDISDPKKLEKWLSDEN